MNGGPLECIRESVLKASLPAKALVGALLAAICGGCGSQRPPVVVGTEPGVTTLVFSNHVVAPLELQRIALEVDGEALPLATIAPDSDELVVLGRVATSPGPHAIHLLATARASDGTADGSVQVFGSSQIFRVGLGPALVRIDLLPVRAESSMRARFTAENAAVEPSIDEPQPDRSDERRCAYMAPLPRAVCRAEATLANASAAHDAVRMGCVRPKLVQMLAIEQTLSSSPADDAALSATQRIGALTEEIDRCVDARETLRPNDGETTVVRLLQ